MEAFGDNNVKYGPCKCGFDVGVLGMIMITAIVLFIFIFEYALHVHSMQVVSDGVDCCRGGQFICRTYSCIVHDVRRAML